MVPFALLWFDDTYKKLYEYDVFLLVTQAYSDVKNTSHLCFVKYTTSFLVGDKMKGTIY